LTDNIDDIIKGCIAGDRKSQEDLYRALSPRMYAVCLQYASDSAEAGDFLQEGFITVFAKIGSFRQEGSFEGWVRKIMINTALQTIRKRKPMFVINDEITDNADYEVPDVQMKMDSDDLLRMVQSLPANQRIVFNLFVIEGYNHQEIAEMTGISENTSKSHLHRARIRLKEMVTKYYTVDNQIIKRNV